MVRGREGALLLLVVVLLSIVEWWRVVEEEGSRKRGGGVGVVLGKREGRGKKAWATGGRTRRTRKRGRTWRRVGGGAALDGCIVCADVECGWRA